MSITTNGIPMTSLTIARSRNESNTVFNMIEMNIIINVIGRIPFSINIFDRLLKSMWVIALMLGKADNA